MTTLHRRDLVMAGSLVAGLAGVGQAGSLPPADATVPLLPTAPLLPTGPLQHSATLSAAEILRRIRLAGTAAQESLRQAVARCPASAQPPSDSRPLHGVPGHGVASLGLDGQPIAYGLRFVCDPRYRNRLEVAGVPLVARQFAFSVDQVNWVPGVGAPLCTTFCPRFDYLHGAAYPECKSHQLVPMVLGQCYFIGCQPQDSCEASAAGAVCFDVNSLHPEQARGHYSVTIWSWS